MGILHRPSHKRVSHRRASPRGHVIDVYLTGVVGVHLCLFVCLVVYLSTSHLTGVHLIGVHLLSRASLLVCLLGCLSVYRASRRRASHRRTSPKPCFAAPLVSLRGPILLPSINACKPDTRKGLIWWG